MNCNATDYISGPMSDGSHSFVMTYKFQRPKADVQYLVCKYLDSKVMRHISCSSLTCHIVKKDHEFLTLQASSPK